MERFLDTPVKRYSSGMYVRLAFAVAAHLEPEILLVDEVLAVGDLDFQRKCLQKMGTIAGGGRTVLFVSHNLGIIHRLCERVVLLHRGHVSEIGTAAEAIRSYLGESFGHQGRWVRPIDQPAAAEVCLRAARIIGRGGGMTGVVDADEPFQIAIDYEVMRPLPNFEIGISLRNDQGVRVFVSLDSDSGDWPERIRAAGWYRSTCQVPSHLLAPGTYHMTFASHIINQQTFDFQHDALAFEVAEAGCIRSKRNDRRDGVVMPIFDWEIRPISRATGDERRNGVNLVATDDGGAC